MPVIVTSAASSRGHAVSAAVFAAVAAWLSSGALAFRSPSGARIGVLPVGAAPLAAALVVAAVVFAIGLRHVRAAAVAVSPLALLIVPWLPVRLPPAFLIWTGALTGPIWLAVALALASVAARGVHAHSTVGPRVHARLALFAGCLVFGLAAWSASAAIPGGDEPHYLVITQSLLHDHDLNVENNYAKGDYRAYYGGSLSPDARVRGRHGVLYSVHAPGVPALVLPAYALGGYHGVVVFLVLVSGAACVLAWWLAWRATKSLTAAWFGWAVVVFAAPFLLESFTVYPDGLGAAIVLTAFWALWRIDTGETLGVKAAVLHGAALAALPWMHIRFALLAAVLGGLIVFRLLRLGNVVRVMSFVAVPVLSAAGWLAAFAAMYGTPNPAAAYGGQNESALTFLPNGLGGLLFDQGFGLIATAPAMLVAFGGLPRARRFAAEWGATAIVYALAVGSYAMWWAGMSSPARFLVPLILPLAIPASLAWQNATSRGARVVMVLALVVTGWLSAVLSAGGGGLLGYHSRNVSGMTPAPWIEWANTVVKVSRALPAFVPQPAGTPLGARIAAARDGFIAVVPWALCFAGAAFFTVWLGRKRGVHLYELIASSAGAFAFGTMLAASAVWWMHDGHSVDTLDAQLDVLRRLSGQHALTLDLMNARRVSTVDGLKMRLDLPIEADNGSPSTLASIPLLPAGSYLISTRGSLRAPAAIFAGADDEPFSLATGTPAEWVRGLTVDLPVAVRALTIASASSAGVSAIEVRPLALRMATSQDPANDRVAHHSAKYGSTAVFFLDDRTAPEMDGFWIWGAREGEVVFAAGDRDIVAVLRNGPVRNDVTIRTGASEQRVTLEPREQRPIRVQRSSVGNPQDVRIVSSAGFRPSDVNPESHDHRYLGVYVALPEHAVR